MSALVADAPAPNLEYPNLNPAPSVLFPSTGLDSQLLAWAKAVYPVADYARIMGQFYCELDDEFLGFLDVYYAASLLTRPNTIVLDFGCYLAAQSVLFEHCRTYVGVDTTDLERFATTNTQHATATIQDFIHANPGLHGRTDVLAVCSYVPDDEARELVNATFPSVVNFYPIRSYQDNPLPALALVDPARSTR